MRGVLFVALLCGGCGEVLETPSDAPDPDGPIVDGPEEPEEVSVAALRAIPDGPANVTVVVTHTYLRQRNLHLQRDQSGPGLSMFVPAAMPLPDMVPGNTVKLHVTQMGTFSGNKQILAATIVENDNGSANLDALSQLLTIAPNEDLEGELVRIQRGTVTAHTPPNIFTVQLSSNAIIKLFSPAGVQVGLCVGATFDLRAVVVEFMGEYEVDSADVLDYANVITTACP